MAIPLSQLTTWTNRSQTDTAINAHTRISNVLNVPDTSLSDIDFKSFLQGSYANHTNIWRDHDVDIVVRFNEAFTYSLELLAEPLKSACRANISPASFTLNEFRPLVLARLREVFGTPNVIEGNKAVRIPGRSGQYMDADVVICQQYRLYYPLIGGGYDFHEGIAFRHLATDRLIVNFPDQHLANGQWKNQRTDEAFKPVVRIFKNARNHLVEHRLIERSIAPSYFIQGLLYNIPEEQFTGDLIMDMLNVLVWLSENADPHQNLLCQNGVQLLFGDTPEQWQHQHAAKFIHEMMRLWNNWS